MCPLNRKFAQGLSDDSPCAPRAACSGMVAQPVALSLLSMPQPRFSAAFEESPMRPANRWGLEHDGFVVLGNVGSSENVPVLVEARSDDTPLRRGHVA